jgi:HNH endonuclease
MTSRSMRALVKSRAANQCEYCCLRQEDAPIAEFHIEHIISKQHGGMDEADNLALACASCNWAKGPNLTGIDPKTGQIVPLFHPRRDVWEEHFQFEWPFIRGLTEIGRTTVSVLAMNSPSRIELRRMIRSTINS